MPSTMVLWNPKAGRVEEAEAVRWRLERAAEVRLVPTASREDAERRAVEAAEAGYARVVAAGGDGTVNAVVNGLMAVGGSVEFAVLPLGTANDFAFSLGVPDELDEAVELVLRGRTRRLDVVAFETADRARCFANVAAGGNSDRVTKCLTEEMKHRWGPLCYLRGAADILTDLVSFDTTVSFDDEPPIRLSLWNVVIANGRTNAGRLAIAPRADLEDGLMDVILIRDGDFLDLAELTVQFTVADYLDSDHVVYRRARSVVIRSKPRMQFSFDGEAIDDQPIVFRCLPRALPMVVGEAYHAGGRV